MSTTIYKRARLAATAALVAGAVLSPVLVSAPAQAAGSPVYYSGFWFQKSQCDAARAQKAADRSFRVSSCKAGFDEWSIPGYYFTYQAAY